MSQHILVHNCGGPLKNMFPILYKEKYSNILYTVEENARMMYRGDNYKSIIYMLYIDILKYQFQCHTANELVNAELIIEVAMKNCPTDIDYTSSSQHFSIFTVCRYSIKLLI